MGGGLTGRAASLLSEGVGWVCGAQEWNCRGVVSSCPDCFPLCPVRVKRLLSLQSCSLRLWEGMLGEGGLGSALSPDGLPLPQGLGY